MIDLLSQISRIVQKKSYFNPKHVDFPETLDYKNLSEQLLQYDIISFDIFDTLLLRKVSTPKTIFDIVGLFINYQFYREIRTEAERSLRSKTDKEITVDQIYVYLEKRYGIPLDTMQIELDLEKRLITKNPYLHSVFNYLIEHKTKQKIIITSDMYLSKDFLKAILISNGFSGFDNVFISSDIGLQKSTGKLFEYIKGIYGETKTYIHVGDNRISDIKNAKSNGWNTYFYKNINERWIREPYMQSSFLSGSVCTALSNIVLYTENKASYYKLGYSFFGIPVLAYCQWLSHLAMMHGADQILFASRDMYIVKKVFDEFFGSEARTEYARVSRFALIRADFRSSFPIFIACVKEILKYKKPTLKELCFAVGMPQTVLEKISDVTGFSCNQEITEHNIENVINAFSKEKDSIADLFREERKNAIDYFSGMKCKGKVIFADLNGRCTGAIILSHLLNCTEKDNIDVICAQLYSTSYPPFLDALKSSGKLECFLFSKFKNPEAKNMFGGIHWKNNTNHMESVFSENIGSLLTYNRTDSDSFEFQDCKNDGKALANIHSGIQDFCRDYMTTTKGKIDIEENDAINNLLSGLFYMEEAKDKNSLDISSLYL